MKKIAIFVIAGMVLGLAVLDNKNIEASEYNQGRDIYENKCQMCHGPKGDGNGPAAAAFHPKPASFTSTKFWEQKNVNKIITDTIERGHRLMPPVDVKSNEITAVIDYISQTFRPRSP